MKNYIFNKSIIECKARAKELADEMTRRHPGVRFSLATPNPLGVKEAKRLHVPGAGLPQAIMNWKSDLPYNETVETRLIESFQALRKITGTEYQTLTSLQHQTGISYLVMFSALNRMRAADPYSITFSVNRLGDATIVKINRK